MRVIIRLLIPFGGEQYRRLAVENGSGSQKSYGYSQVPFTTGLVLPPAQSYARART